MNRGLYTGLDEGPERQLLYFDGTGNLAIGNLALNVIQPISEATTSTLNGFNTIAIGDNAGASITAGGQDVLIGVNAGTLTTVAVNNVVIGYNAAATTALGNTNVIIGAAAVAFAAAASNVIIGGASSVTGSGNANVVIGAGATSAGGNAVVVGDNASCAGGTGVAVGQGASVSAAGSIAIGSGASTGSGVNGIVIGKGSITGSVAGAVALGTDSGGTGATTATANEIALGTSNQTLHFFGGLKGPVLSKTNTYGMAATDFCILANGTFTVTLPSPTLGAFYIIKNTGSGTITVSQHNSETIDGATTVSLATQYEAITVTSDGTNWFVIGQVATSIL